MMQLVEVVPVAEKKPKRENNPTIIGLTQYLDPEYWDWANPKTSERRQKDGTLVDNRMELSLEQAQALVTEGSAEELADYLVRRLEFQGDFFAEKQTDKTLEEHPGTEVAEAYGIIHDRDELTLWSEEHGDYITELKPRHIHMVIKFAGRKAGQSAPLGYLAKRLGVEDQYVEKPGKGAHAYDNMLSYLIHIKYPDKFQYEQSDVATVRGRDYSEIYAHRRADWLKGRGVVRAKKAAEDVEDLIDKILEGEIVKGQLTIDSDLRSIYGRHKRKVDDALKVRAEMEEQVRQAELERTLGHTWMKSAVAVIGPRRSGKEVFAKMFLSKLQALAGHAGRRWRIVKPPGSHSLESVEDAELVHHEDGRFYAFRSYDQMLRYLDPSQAVQAEGRNYHRGVPAPRVAVLTSSNTLEEFGLTALARKPSQVLEDDAAKGTKRAPADIDEFLLRLGWVVEVQKPARTVDDIVIAEDLGETEAFSIFCEEALVGIYRPRGKSAGRTEQVHARNGALLGEITTATELEPVGMLRGIDRAARFLAAEVMYERNQDIVAAMSEEVARDLAGEHQLITGELTQQIAEERELRNQHIDRAVNDYQAVYGRLYPGMPVHIPRQKPDDDEVSYLVWLRGEIDKMLDTEVAQREQRAAAVAS